MLLLEQHHENLPKVVIDGDSGEAGGAADLFSGRGPTHLGQGIPAVLWYNSGQMREDFWPGPMDPV